MLVGAGISIVQDGAHQGTLATAGELGAAVDELQFDLGEGPCISTDAAFAPVLEPDLSASGGLWPAFTPAALALGVLATFAFPLRVGAINVGVLSLYRAGPGDLSLTDLADAIELVQVVTQVLLELEAGLPPGMLPEHLADVVDQRAAIHQATGMVAAQLDTDVATALGRLRVRAWSNGQRLDDFARQVVARELRFDDE